MIRGLVVHGFGDGIAKLGNSVGTRVAGNFTGNDKSGTKDLGNDDTGVFVSNASGTTVGGTTAASRNLISGNLFDSITVFSSQDAKALVWGLSGIRTVSARCA